MRHLRYTVELPDGSHHEHAPVGYGDAEHLVRNMDWTAVRAVSLEDRGSGDGEGPFLLFLDEGESFFMILPQDDGYRVTARVADKWNLLGLMTRQKSFTLEFGLLGREDALVLLKLFFEDNYPALRALNKELGWDREAGLGR
jgi:hypothetical protein